MLSVTVMTLESYDDPSTRLMLKSLYENDSFRELEVKHCFIENASDSNELLEILDQAARQYKPNMILIHTGAEFHRLREYFPEALTRLRTRFPGLCIGAQDRRRLSAAIASLLDVNSECIEMEEKFFAIRR